MWQWRQAEVLQEGYAAAFFTIKIVEHGFETLGGLLLNEVVFALSKGQPVHVDSGSGEDDLWLGGLGFVLDDFEGIHVVEHVDDLLLVKEQPASQGPLRDGHEVGKEPPIHSQHEGKKIGITGLLRYLEAVNLVAGDGHKDARFGIGAVG